MISEEAIKELEILKEDYWEDDGYGHETKQYDNTMLALDMAIKALEQETVSKESYDHEYCLRKEFELKIAKLEHDKNEVLDKIRAEIIEYEGDCRLSVDEYPSCKQCTDSVFETIYGILDKYKAESEET